MGKKKTQKILEDDDDDDIEEICISEDSVPNKGKAKKKGENSKKENTKQKKGNASTSKDDKNSKKNNIKNKNKMIISESEQSEEDSFEDKKPSKQQENKRKTRNKVNKSMQEDSDESEEEKTIKKNQKKKPTKSKKQSSDDEDFNADMEEEHDDEDALNDLDKEDDDFQGDDDDFEEKPKKKGKKNNISKSKSSKNKNTSRSISPSVSKSTKKPKKQNGTQSDIDSQDEAIFYENEGAKGSIEDRIQLPDFMLPENIKDVDGNRPDSPNYDPSTIKLQKGFFEGQSPVFQQYWETKRENFDKIVFFRFGRNFMVFYNDAFIVHKLLNMYVKTWGKGRPYINLWDSQYPMVVKTLLKNGYQAIIVDQIEKKQENQDLMKREVTQIITQGTFTDDYHQNFSEFEETDYNPRYLISIVMSASDLSFGIVVVEASTNQIYLDEFIDDKQYTNLRTILKRLKPVEVVYDKDNLTLEVIKMCKQISNPSLTKTNLDFVDVKEGIDIIFQQFNETYKAPIIMHEIQDLYETDNKQYQEEKQKKLKQKKQKNQKKSKKNKMEEEDEQEEDSDGEENLNTDFQYYMLIQTIVMTLKYLEKLKLENVFKTSTFKIMDSSIEKQEFLHMDAHALENLDVFEARQTDNSISEKGSLFDYICYTSSAFGKRLLKKWLIQPLKNVNFIKERSTAVKDLMKEPQLIQTFQQKLKKIPDIERLTARVYNALQASRLKSSSYDSFPVQRFKDLILLLKYFETIPEIQELFDNYVQDFESTRLRNLVTIKKDSKSKNSSAKKSAQKDTSSFFASYIQNINEQKKRRQQNKEIEGLFPSISEIIEELQDMLEPNKDDTTFLEPKKGLNEVYDNISKKINNTMHSLNEILEYWKKTLKCPTIKFTHTKQRYQLDIENKYVEGDKRPSEFILVGKTKKTLRFYTQEIEDKVTDLKELEDQKQEQLIPFIMEYIEKFYKHKDLWFHTISCLSEIDCYCSLAKCASKMGEESCQPEFTNKNMFELKNMYHPCLMKAGYKMVPNDTEFKEGVTGLLVTGPNMGGKSTLLRQTCLAVILAQIGSFVPAKSFLLKPVDRIFCRIGANDKLLEGKSTFFVEMEETQVIVQEATQDSIVLLDELGRGTSTYDGVSIAYSVLKHLMEEIKCKVLFATHYHSLLDDFKLYKNVENYMMDYSYNSQDKKLSFTYKFVKGESDRSFGVNCAKVVGLCEEIQNLAEEKEREMNSECEQLGKDRIKNQNFNSIISALLENSHKKSIQQLTQLTKTLKI